MERTLESRLKVTSWASHRSTLSPYLYFHKVIVRIKEDNELWMIPI